jgi:hypothetical protein
VVWDEAVNRPVSTRCQAHGGLADAALMGWRSPDVKEESSTMSAMPGSVHTLADPATNFRAIGRSRPLGGLLALVLAAALSLSPAGPALADFESAVAAYEQGAYQEANEEFQGLAAAGDERAESYLEKIQEKLAGAGETERAGSSSLMDTITSFFEGPDRPHLSDAAASDAANTRSAAADRPSPDASGTKLASGTPRSPSNRGSEAGPSAPLPEVGVVIPQHESSWSTFFHLPADATVIGLQYAAQFIGAQTLVRELQLMSRHRDEIALSILAGLWWLAIVRGLVGIAVAISRFTKAAATLREPHHYG